METSPTQNIHGRPCKMLLPNDLVTVRTSKVKDTDLNSATAIL